MFRRSINQFFFALIKPNKPPKQPQLTPHRINNCRELLMMTSCFKDSIQDKTKSYIQDRVNFSIQQVSADSIYKYWDLYQPLNCQIGVLSFRGKLTNIESKYLYKILQEWAQFLLKQQRRVKEEGSPRLKENYRRILIEFAQAFNSICYLLKLDEKMIFLYLRIYLYSQNYKMEDKCYSHLRYVLDNLLLLDRIHQSNLKFILIFTSKFPMQSIYYQKEKDIMELVYSSLPQLTNQSEKTSKMLISLFYNLNSQSQISTKMKKLIFNIYHKFTNSQVRLKAFINLIDLFEINKHNITEKVHLQNLKQFIQKHPKEAFKQISKLLFRADIWIKEFWVPYFQYLSNQQAFKEIEPFNHFVIDDLLVQAKAGGPELYRIALEFRNHLKRNNMDPQAYNLRNEYEKLYGRIKEHKSSCQLHVANSMRLVCGAQILTEVPIKYFMVDILVNQKVIVQINNTHHYKIIDGVQHLNLKSQFRQRILEANGYKFYTIKVDDLNSSNYSMLQEIYRIVQQSGSMKKIDKKANE